MSKEKNERWESACINIEQNIGSLASDKITKNKQRPCQRAPPGRWFSRVTDWSPVEGRKRGRPRRSFRGKID